MKPEEAVKRQEAIAGSPYPNQYISHVDREALRIVLAMAKAAQGMAEALEAATLHVYWPHVARTPAGRIVDASAKATLAEFRKASGGDAP